MLKKNSKASLDPISLLLNRTLRESQSLVVCRLPAPNGLLILGRFGDSVKI
jgi:hypothetical protein